jgi:hypothetical protein
MSQAQSVGDFGLAEATDKADTSSVTAAFDVGEDHTAGGYAILRISGANEGSTDDSSNRRI